MVKKLNPTPKSSSLSKSSSLPQSTSPMIRYVLIFALVILLGFAIMYVYNIQKSVKEKFEEAKYTVTYIYRDGCPWCDKFNPVWDSWANANSGKYNVRKLSTDEAQDKIAAYNITGYPTVIIEAQGKGLVSKKVGYCDYSNLDAFVNDMTKSIA